MPEQVQLDNLTAEEYKAILGIDTLKIGDSIQLDESTRLINLTSDAPNLVDTGIFSAMLEILPGIALDVAVGVLASYIYDKLKAGNSPAAKGVGKRSIVISVGNKLKVTVDRE